MRKSMLRQKQNIRPSFCPQQRLSLKVQTKNAQKSKHNRQQENSRMSMQPLRRQRASFTHSALSQCRTLKYSIDQLNCTKTVRKEAILSNLVNKLDQQQEIRKIMESKLKKSSFRSSQVNHCRYHDSPQRDIVSQVRPFQQSRKSSLFKSTQRLDKYDASTEIPFIKRVQKESTSAEQLKSCKAQLQCFKILVIQMSKRITELQKQKSKGKQEKQQCGCKKKQKGKAKQPYTKSVLTQTDSFSKQPSSQKEEDPEFDFYRSLDTTLKILNNSKFPR